MKHIKSFNESESNIRVISKDKEYALHGYSHEDFAGNYDFAGNFELPTSRNTYVMYKLNDKDKKFVARFTGIKLKPSENIFRYETETTKIGGMQPLVKINVDKGLVYFLTPDANKNDEVAFETKGNKAKFINIPESQVEWDVETGKILSFKH